MKKYLIFSEKNPIYLLGGILVIAIIFRLYNFDETIPLSMDALDYFSYAADIHTIGGLPVNYDIAKPGWSYFLAAIFSVFNFEQTMLYMQLQKLLTISISSLAIFPLFFLIKKFFTSKYSLLGVLLFAVEPRIIQNSLNGNAEPLFILTLIITVLLFLSKNEKIVYCAFITAGIATCIRPEGFFLFLGITVMFIIRFSGQRVVIPKYFIGLVLFLLIIAPISIHQYQVGMYESAPVRVYSTINSFFINEENSPGLGNDISTNVASDAMNESILKKNYAELVITSVTNFPKYLGWTLIPMFILLAPLGFIMFFRNLKIDKLTLIILTGIMSIPAFYAYSFPLLEIKYLYFLFPMFCVFSTYSLRLFIEKFHFKKILFGVCFVAIITSSILFIDLKFDNTHERESAFIASYVVENTKVVNSYHPESKYIWGFDVPKKWTEYKVFYENMDRVENVDVSKVELHHPRQVWVKDPNNFESLESFLSNSERGNISHLVLDGKTDRTEFLNEIFYNEDKYEFLNKIYDSTDDGLEYHVKIFEVNYDLFENGDI